MPKQYYAVVDNAKHEVVGMSPKVWTEEEAITSLVCKGRRKRKLSARSLGGSKPNAEEAIKAVESEVRDARRLRENASAASVEKDLRDALVKIVADHEEARAGFLKAISESDDLANFFSWNAAANVVESEHMAKFAKRVLRLAEEKPERHLYDWAFWSLRYEAKNAALARHEGSNNFWSIASKASAAEGRRRLLEGMSSLSWAIHQGQACIEAREKLGLEPPPWTKVNTAYVQMAFEVPGFESK